MFARGLKSKIAINIAGILLLGMLLIDFVTISTAQRDIVGNEITKGFLLISAFQEARSRLPIYGHRAGRLLPIYPDCYRDHMWLG